MGGMVVILRRVERSMMVQLQSASLLRRAQDLTQVKSGMAILCSDNVSGNIILVT